MTREEMVREISLSKQALMRAGPVHFRDLQKHIHRMEVQLKQYDRYQRDAKRRCRADAYQEERKDA